MGNTSLFDKALGLEQSGRFAEALQLFQACFADPTFDEGDLCFHCGWCLENEKNAGRAVAFYEKAAALTRIPSCKLNGYFRAGWVLMHEKSFAQAADMFRFAIDYGELVALKNETFVHAVYWHALCLESQGCYLDALKWYRLAQALAPQIGPESRMRQILCLNRVGLFEEALNVCRTFDAPAPEEFDYARYEALRMDVEKERAMYGEQCLMPRTCSRVSHAIS